MPALPQARDYGKIILKLLNHLAIIILRIVASAALAATNKQNDYLAE